ncbi:hypothetical protein G647_06216 [Cladophialophora carrionii CBS 160.54]|uniref:Guanine nucleotide-binding protein subunit alpha n=1 Tax=Cladophialophora carrionii CBS 160.54 TaxID=1279043 RepID=V9D775_9EURO|nr:uncharacterized protein G647_06216 [Cladophialophora carrionii CBS 160.54]ETI22143.1 hypothetical protein G647_06216 [Cladophialophora carrionii CBS 160.54]
MGCTFTKEDDDGRAEHNQIEKELKLDHMSRTREIKILMLGTGDSGKSTVLKQLKLINGGGYSDEELTFFKGVICTNIVQSMQAVLEAMDVFGIPFASPATANPHASLIFSHRQQITARELSPAVYGAVKTLWDDAGVRACFSRCSEFQVCDSAQYYFDQIDRIAADSFVPNDQDILRSRQKTTGVAEFSFTATSTSSTDTVYRIIDVGGQRSERKKWMHHFEDVDLVLFLVALSEYDQALYEDGSVNRLQEALDLFHSICQSQWFRRTAVQLVFNKTDLFREKLKHSPLEAYFPDFQGGADYAAAREYIANRFISMGQTRYPDNYLCATDTAQVRLLMGRIIDRL